MGAAQRNRQAGPMKKHGAFRRMATRCVVLAALAAAVPAVPACAAGNPFAPAVYVNESVVTNFEIDQRARFLILLRAPGDPLVEAEKALIEDRLRLEAAKQLGISVTAEQIQSGMTEFASRANLDTEQFLAAISQGGVEPETFRDFVEAGLLWREVIRARFGSRVTVSEAEIDRALSFTAGRGAGPRVLLSEIIIPTTGADAQKAQVIAEELAATPLSEAAFADAARRYSGAPSRDQGGRVDWVPLTNLPPQAQSLILGMQRGQVTAPITLPGAIALYQLRGLEEGGEIQPGNIVVDYAQYLIPGGRTPAALAEAERVRGRADTCDDLYTVARGQPAERLLRESLPLPSVPADVARELATLDEGDASTGLTRGANLVYLMLCSRTATAPRGAMPAATIPPVEGAPAIDDEAGVAKGPTRDSVRAEITNRKLTQLADGLLEEMVADAIVRRP